MLSLASFLIALAAVPATMHGLAPLDTTPLYARSLVADTAASTSPTAAAEEFDRSRAAALDSLESHPTAPASVMFAPTLIGERLAREDTVVHKRRRAVVMSDAAILRLRIHRYASYTVIPLFALQSIAGNQLLQADNGGVERPGWAKSAHSFGAAAIGTVFAVNTITGVWGLYDARQNDQNRALRWAHSILMLASDAGFTWTGIKLADDAKRSSSDRNLHRNWAYASMGTALVGYGIMYFGNR
jgi:hypothetical protein